MCSGGFQWPQLVGPGSAYRSDAHLLLLRASIAVATDAGLVLVLAHVAHLCRAGAHERLWLAAATASWLLAVGGVASTLLWFAQQRFQVALLLSSSVYPPRVGLFERLHPVEIMAGLLQCFGAILATVTLCAMGRTIKTILRNPPARRVD
jgi:hypothetical protein